MFNVRVKRYLNTEQIQVFSKPIFEKEDKVREKKFIRSTGEICPLNRTILYDVPFEEGPVIGVNMHDEDIQRSVRRTKNMIYDIARSNEWHWFFTLTFNPEKVDSFDYDIVTKKLSLWLNNMRRKCPDMKYIVVPEQHKSGRWHFHGLFANVEDMVFVDSGVKDGKARVVYNVGNYKLGFSTATQISHLEKACSYISKYTTKELCEVTSGKKRYWASRNVDLPKEEVFYINLGNEELQRIKDMGYRSDVSCAFNEVTYLELPIYTTNTSRFVMNEMSDNEKE